MTGNTGSGKSNDTDLLFGSDSAFLIMAAHELKAPLALMRQLSLSLQHQTLSEQDKQHLFERMVLTSERALRLTTDLTRSSRLQDSLFDLEPLNPQQICEEVAHELSPLYAAKGRTIQVATRHRPLLAVANKDLLRRIMMNFGDNALHYSEPSRPVTLEAGLKENGSRVRIGVRDFGPAVPIDIWQRLQSSLGAEQQLLHSRPQSSGLGLYVAGQFAGAMRGRIGATRHRDGATFYVDIDASTQLSLL